METKKETRHEKIDINATRRKRQKGIYSLTINKNRSSIYNINKVRWKRKNIVNLCKRELDKVKANHKSYMGSFGAL